MKAGISNQMHRFPRPPVGAELSPQQALRDDNPLDLVGPFVDLGERSTPSIVSIKAESIGIPVHLRSPDPRSWSQL